ncbi:MAG: 2-amino-4-hydroxy-6-hydroxymethyldihydropteridine diphosphokinase [Omnitrophica WOR_2 bacterium RIFCSPHIGHO2_02_FULL_52_10]|nr:MAG: 2-amino-4-hydroxy-6-hydroxymethyldihydropteridine diphosphokinase [Omnitrophica WOR_2 bacterium RIFCSPHIGHO2_02_FULL_52_10]
MNQAVIGLGSNIAPQENLRKARSILSRKFRIVSESRFRTTRPIGEIRQPDFINGSVLIETASGIDELKAALKAIESQLGRDGSQDPFGPRTIDLDIVVWNKTVVDRDFYRREYLKHSVLELLPDLDY